jgi:hypothetical protein
VEAPPHSGFNIPGKSTLHVSGTVIMAPLGRDHPIGRHSTLKAAT